MKRKWYLILVLVFLFSLAGLNAQAEEAAPAPAAPPAAAPAPEAAPAPAPEAAPAPAAVAKEEAKPEEAKPENPDGKIGRITIAPRLGYAFYGSMKTFNTDTFGGAGAVTGFDLGNRNAMNLMLEFDFGGAGSSFELAPYYAFEQPSAGGSGINALGLYLGYAYKWHKADWYPSFGFGLKTGYMMGSDLDWGVETALVLPVGFTYYILEDLGIIAQLGLGWESSIYKGGGMSDYAASTGLYADFMVGVRWP